MAKTQLILNRYEPLSQAGAGGFATVQVAWDTRIQRKVAIKCLPLSGTSASAFAGAIDPGQSTSLTQNLAAPLETTLSNIPGLDEARTAAMLQDQNIVAVFDFEIQDSMAYLIMEYVEGLTLAQVLRDHADEVTLDVIAAVFHGVAHALTMAHRAGVLHLDIKPDNILISQSGQVKVTDFGLATLADAQGFGTTGGGTIGYMPLEQMREQSLDARCDEWALAAVSYEMLTAENPFRANSLDAAQAAIENAELVLPSFCWDALGPDADDVLFYALDPDREERYASVSDFAEEFQPLLGNVKQGTKDLSEIVTGTFEQEPEEETLEQASARIPLREQITPGVRTAAAHTVGAVGAALISAVALWNIPQTTGVDNPLFWGILALAVAAGAFRPHLGALVGGVTFGVALVVLGAPALGCVLVAATVLWWWFIGRIPVNIELPEEALRNAAGADNPANVVNAAVLGGAVGLGPLGPLSAGFCLPPARACVTAVYQVLLCFALASLGSCSLFTWDALSFFLSPTNVAENAFAMLQSVSFWAAALTWVLAAWAAAAFRRWRPTRKPAIFATVTAGVVLLLGVGVGVLADLQLRGLALEGPLLNYVDPVALASVLISTAAVLIFATLVPDFKRAED